MPVLAMFCSADAGMIEDAGVADAGNVDAGVIDAGDIDAGVSDAGSNDAGSNDAGSIDAGADAGAGAPIITSQPSLSSVCFALWEYQPLVTGTVDQWTLEAPAGAFIDAANGSISWTPITAQAGTQRLSVTAQNAAGAATQTFDVEVSCERRKLNIGFGCSAGGDGVLLMIALTLLRRRLITSPRCAAPPRACGFR